MSDSARMRRLNRLEQRVNGQGFAVTMPNGAKLGLRVRDPLALLLAGFDRQYHAIMGEPDAATRYDPILNALAGSESVDTDENVVLLARDSAKEAKRERETGAVRLALQSLEESKGE